MSFTTGAALLDAVVLAIVSKEPEGAYGYKITQEIKQALDLSESTLTLCCAVCRRTDTLPLTMPPAMAATAVIT